MESPSGRGGVQPPLDLGRVGRVGHQQHVVVVAVVGDEVVDHSAGRRVAGERVLRLPGTDAAEVVAQAAVEVLHRTVSAHHDLPEVADVEDPDRTTDGSVFLQYAGGVLQWHLPATELGELRPRGGVTVVKRRVRERHAWQVTAALGHRHGGRVRDGLA